MNLRTNKFKVAVLFCLLLAVVAISWIVSLNAGSSPIKFDGPAASQVSVITPQSITDGALNSVEPLSGSQQSAARRFIPTANSLAVVQNMAEIQQEALNAKDVATRSFAIFMPPILCDAFSNARSFGASSFEADIPLKRITHDAKGMERVAHRCSEYYVVVAGKMRSEVLASLKTEKAPLMAFFSVKDGPPQAARDQLARVLTEYDPTALQPLSMIWPIYNTDRIASTLPAELKPYAQGISTAAFDLALCRLGASCETGSIALDLVCAKYAACDASDVETAYRRLHDTAGISFVETSKIADGIADAIRRRDMNVFWPDTSKRSNARR